MAAAPPAWALPQGGLPTAGSVSLRADGATRLEIVQTSAQAAIDWKSFSIAAGERVRIVQPDVAAVLFNRVTGADPSLILGQLQANGRVFLSNPRGVIFGAGSRVDVGSLVATTLNVDSTRLADGRWQLSGGTAATGELRADGEIHAPGGTVALVGPRISLGGNVLAGRLGLAAVGAVQVDVDGDGLIFFNARSEDLATRLDLLGSASALAGSAELRAVARAGFADTVLNLEGTVRARGLTLRDGQVMIDGGPAGLTRVAGSVQARSQDEAGAERGGAITVLGDQLQLAGTARLDASGAAGGGAVRVGGDYQGGNATSFAHARTVDVQAGATLAADATQAGQGGRVIVWSDGRTSFAGAASVRGGPGGGDGGLVEVSSRRDLVFAGEADRRAPQGRAGLLLLDPATMTVQTTADGTANTIAASAVVTALNGGDFTISADTTVTVNAAITSATTAAQATSGALTLSVGNVGTPSIAINADINIQGTGKALTLSAPTIAVADVALAAAGGIALGGATTWTVGSGSTRAVASALSGAGSLVKAGTGTLTLNAVNSYAGGTTVSAGTLSLGASSALPAGKAVTVSNGALDLNGNSPSVGVFTLSGGSVTDAGATPGALTATQFAVSQGTASAVLAGAAATLTKTGTGTVTLSAANTYGGGTTVSAGTLSLGAGSALPAGKAVTVDGGALDLNGNSPSVGVFTLSGGSVTDAGATPGTLTATQFAVSQGTASAVLAGAAATLAKTGAGIVTLSAANTYGGGTTVSAGTLTAGTASVDEPAPAAAGTLASGPFGTGAVTVASGGAVDLAGHAVDNAWSLAGTGVGGTGALRSSTGAARSGGAVTLTANTTLGAAGTATLVLSGLIADAPVPPGNAAVAQALAVQGGGVVTLGGANTYTGGTQVGSGVSLVAAADSAGTAAVLTSSPFGTGTVTVASGGAVDLAGHAVDNAWSLAGTGVGGSGALRNSIGSGTASSGGAITLAADATVGVANGARLSLSGDIAAAAQSLAVQGSGVVTLGGANTHTGGTQVGSGVSLVAAADSTGTAAALTSSPFGIGTVTVASGGAVDLAGHAVDNAWSLAGTGVGGSGALRNSIGSGTASSGGAITLAADATVGVASGARLSLSGDIAAGAQSLALQGSGVVTLGGASTHTGGTQVGSGVSLVAAADSAGTAAVLTSSPFGTGTVTVASGGAVDLAGHAVDNAWSLAGTGVGGSGALRNSIGTASSGGAIGLAAAASLGASGTAGLTLSGDIGGSGVLGKLGTGLLTLSGASSFADGLQVQAGTLRAGAASSGIAGALVSGPFGTGTVTVAAGAAVDLAGFTVHNAWSLAGDGLASTGVLRSSAEGARSDGDVDLQADATIAVGLGQRLRLGGTVSGAGGLAKIGAGTLVLTGSVAPGGGTTVMAGTLQLGSGGSGASLAGSVALDASTLSFAGADNPFVTATISGTGSVVQSGTGRLTLLGANTYSGGTMVSSGQLVAGRDSVGAAGSLTSGPLGTGLVTVESGASVDLAGRTLNNAWLLAGSGPAGVGALRSTGADASLGGAVTLAAAGATIAVDAATRLQLAGPVDGSGALTKIGDGTLLLTAAATATGGTTLSAGVLQVGNGGSGANAGSLAGPVVNNGTLRFQRADASVFDGDISGSGALELAGPGRLTLTGQASHSGGTTVAAGSTLRIGDGGVTGSLAGAVANEGALVFARSDTARFDGVVSGGGRVEQAGSGSLVITADQGHGGGTLVSAGRLQLGDGGTSGGVAGNVTVNSGTQLVFRRADDLVFGGTVSGAGGVTQAGAGLLSFGSDQTYTGGTTISAGSALRLGTGGSSGRVLGDIGNDGTLRVQRSDVLTLNGALVGNGRLELDAGTLVLAGAHGGTGASNLASGSLLVIDRAVATAWAGDVSGAGGVEKRGAGTLTVTGAWSPGAGTRIAAGTLQIGDGGSAGSLAGAVQDDAALVFKRSDRLTLASPVSGSGRLEQAGTGTLVFTGTASHLGGTRISAGSLQIGNGGSQGTLAGDVVNAGQLVFQRSDALTFDGLVSGAGSLAQAGSGTLTLTAANTYGGGTAVRAGTLVAGRDSSSAGSSLVSGPFGRGTVSVSGAGAGVDLAGHTVDNAWVLAGSQALRSSSGQAASAGALSLSGNAGITVGGTQLALTGAVSGAGTLTLQGPGRLWLRGDNTASGGTTVASGTLALDGGTDRAGSGTLQVNHGAMLELSGGALLTVPVSLAGTLVNAQAMSTLRGLVTLGDDVLLLVAGDGLVLNGGLAQGGGVARSITKSGSGSLSLGGVNTVGGSLNVLAGQLIVTGSRALGDTATLQLAAGSTLQLQADANVGALGGLGTLNLDRYTLGTGGNNASTRFDGLVTGGPSSGLTKRGAGNFTLGHANTYTGATQVLDGTLTLAVAGASGNASAVTLGSGATLVLQADQTWGSLTGGGRVELGAHGLAVGANDLDTLFSGTLAGTGVLVKQGAGTLLLAGASSYSGGSTVESGGLVAGSGSSGLAGALSTSPFGTGAVRILAGASVDLAGRTVDNDWTLAGPAALRNGTGSASSAGRITLSASSGIQVGGTQLALSGAITGPGALTLQGGGSLLLSGANGYLGGTTVGAGTLVLSGGINRAGPGALRVDPGATLDLSDDAQVSVPISLAGSLGNSRGRGSSTGVLTLAADAGVQVGGDGLTLGGALTQSGGARALSKTGAGTLTITGSNDATGLLSVLAGTLVAAGGQALGDAATLQLALGSTLVLQASETVGALAGQGAVALGTATLAAGGNGASTVFAGTLSGAGGLVKQGTGTLTLAGSNLHTGATVVQAGTLSLAAAGAAGDRSAVTVAAGATLVLQADQALGSLDGAGAVAQDRFALSVGADGRSSRFDGTLAGSGSLTKTGGGTLTLGGADGRSGDTSVQQGSLVLASGSAAAAASAYSVASGATLVLQADAALATLAGAGTVSLAPGTLSLGADGRSSSFSGLLQGSGDLVKQGAGTLTLSGTSSRTGRTRVLGGSLSVPGDAQLGVAPAGLVADQLLLDGGTLQVTADTTLAATRGLTLQGAGGTLLVPTGVQVALAGPVADGASAGALTVSGGGTLSLTGEADNRYSGGTTLRHASLSIARDGQLGAASAALQLDGGTLALRDSLRLDSQRELQLGAGGGTLQVPGGVMLQIGGRIADAAGAADGALVLQGGGTLVLDGAAANAYSGATAVLGSTLQLSRDDQLGTAPATARAGQLRLDGGTLALDLAAAETLTLDARRGLALGAAGGTLQVAGGTLQLPGVVADATGGTPGSLTKTGTGTLLLAGSAPNSHSGGTQVLAGTLGLSRDDALGAAASSLLLDGGRLQVDSGFALATGRTLQLGAAGAGIAVAAGQTLAVSGPVSETAGPSTLTKTGDGTLAFSGSTDHARSGSTQVLGGTLAISHDGQLGTAPGVATPGQLLLDGATLRLDANTTLAATRGIALGAGGGTLAVADGVVARVDGVIADAGLTPASLAKAGAGTLMLAGDNRHGGGTDVLAGTLATAGDERLPDAGALRLAGGSRFTLGGHETVGALADLDGVAPPGPPSRLVLDRYVLTVRQSIDTRFSGQIDTGSGQLVKEGPGTLAMAGSGSGNGLFQVNSGMLVSASADLLTPDTTVQVADLATLRLDSAVSVQSLALAGTLTGSGRMTVSQNTTIDGGTLRTAVTTNSLTSRHQATVQAPLTVTATATVDGGTLTLDAGGLLQAGRVQLVNAATLATVAAGQLGTSAVLALAGGSLLQLAGAETAASLSLADGSRLAAVAGASPVLTLSGQVTLEASSLAVPVQAAQFSSSGASELDAALRLSQSAALGGGTLTLGPGGVIDAPVFTLQAGTLRTTDAQALGSGSTALRIDAPATLQLGAPATVATLSLAGTVQLAPVAPAAPAAAVPAAGDRTAAAVKADAPAASAGLDATQAVTLDGGHIGVPLSTGEFRVTGLGTVAAPVQAAGQTTVDGTLTLADGGTLATPRLQLASGTLVTQASGQLLGAPVLQMAAGTLLQLGGDETLGALVDASGANGARVMLGAHTLSVGSAAADATTVDRFSGVLSGSGSVVKQGLGTWLLSADQAHGDTRIAAGTLQLGVGGSSGSLGSGDLVNDGLLRVQRSDTLTLTQAMRGSGALEQAGSGTLVLASAANAYSGATRVLSGTLATPGDERLSDASALSVAAGATLRLGGRETVAGLDADGAVFLGGSLASTTGGQRYGAAVTVTAGAPITLSAPGQTIEALNDGNRWTLQPLSLTAGQLRLSAGRRETGVWNDLGLGEVHIGASGASGAGEAGSLIEARRILIGQATGAATGDARLDGLLRVEGGSLTLRAHGQPDYSLLAPLASGRQAVDPQQGRLMQVADDVIAQGAASRVETLAGAGLVLHAVAGGSITLANVDNRLAGPVQALSGAAWNSAWQPVELAGNREVGQSRITLAGQELVIGGQGLEADLVRLSAGRLATVDGSRIAARLWYNDAGFGVQNSAPGLVLELLPQAFATALPFGSAEAPIVANVGGKSLGGRSDGLAAGFVELLPRNAGASGTVVFLAGPKLGETGYSFFNAGAGDQSQLPLFYNGVLPATPQLSGSLSAVASVSENARRERFEETVRTENVAIRLRAGVIAEVGPGRPATGGAEGLRAPQPCRAEAGRLDCPPAGAAP